MQPSIFLTLERTFNQSESWQGTKSLAIAQDTLVEKNLGFRLQRRYTVKCAEACIACRLFAKFILDREQAVVLGYSLATYRYPGFDLPAIRRNDEIGDGGIHCLTRAMGDDRREGSTPGHLDHFQRFCQRTDLIELD